MSRRTRRWAFVALGAFVAMIALAATGAALQAIGWSPDPAQQQWLGYAVGAAFFVLFLVLGFAMVPLMIGVFVALQTRVGNGDVAPIRWLREHEVGASRAVWAVLAAGLAIATPAMLYDLGVRPSVGASEGVLVARIGMPIDEVRSRSSLALGEGVLEKLTGVRNFIGQPVFDFEIADSGVRFERCRYYLMTTRPDGDPHVNAISIGVSPEAMTRDALVAAHADVQRRLAADGWQPGRYEYDTPEERALHGGVASSGDGFLWKQGETVLRLEGNRVNEPGPGEDEAQARSWIQVIELRPPTSFADATFDPAATP